MNVYSVKCTYTDRRYGPGTGQTFNRIEASSIRIAVNKALYAFRRRLDRRQNFDANRSLKIEAHFTGKDSHA